MNPFRWMGKHLLGERLTTAIPSQVTEELVACQRQSEVITCVLQFLIIGFFGTLYLLSPSSAPEDATLEPVPLAMGGWLLFALLRLIVVLRKYRTDNFFVGLGLVLDMAFLVGLIYSFHIQYAQPVGFSLKAPALVYVFLFIALRTIRFDARLVLVTGLSAAAGWGLMVWVAIDQDGGPEIMRTFDYIDYIYSARVLYGAETEKILAILTVTLVLALALVRANRIMTRSISEQFASANLSKFFDADVAAKIRDSGQALAAGEGEFRQCAVMFVDLRGFTPMSQMMPPRDLIALLGEYQSKAVPAVRRYHGAIDKFMGDGIMVTFGAVVPLESYAADAMRAADELIRVARAWQEERTAAGLPAPGVGCALATGKVTAGLIGHGDRLEFTVIGDAVNLAAKLEKHTKTEECTALTTRETLELALSQGYIPQSPKVVRSGRKVGGAGEPIDLCVIA